MRLSMFALCGHPRFRRIGHVPLAHCKNGIPNAHCRSLANGELPRAARLMHIHENLNLSPMLGSVTRKAHVCQLAKLQIKRRRVGAPLKVQSWEEMRSVTQTDSP